MAHIPEQETYEGELEETPVNDQDKPKTRNLTIKDVYVAIISLGQGTFVQKDIERTLFTSQYHDSGRVYFHLRKLVIKRKIRSVGRVSGGAAIQYELTDKDSGQASGPPQATDTVKIGKIPGIDTVVHKGPMIKICRDCQKPLSIDQFQHNNRSKDGHLHICMQCHKDRTHHIPTPDRRANSLLKIPIDDYQWIISRLKVAGKLTKNLRTWPQQALVYILQGLERDGITGEE